MTATLRADRSLRHDPSVTLVTETLASPLGTLTVIASERGLRAVLWPGEQYDQAGRVRPRRAGDLAPQAGHAASCDTADADRAGATLRSAAAQLDEYFAGSRREFDLPLDPHGTEFQLAAWRVLRAIPYGQTLTYAEQARALGDANKARAVGAANGRNPLSIIVPCHRVVGADGSLTGFAGGTDAKSWLLRHERRNAGLA